jgi:hypothetical protein
MSLLGNASHTESNVSNKAHPGSKDVQQSKCNHAALIGQAASEA